MNGSRCAVLPCPAGDARAVINRGLPGVLLIANSNRATARIEQRAFGLLDCLGQFFDLFGMAVHGRSVAAEADLGWEVGFRGCLLHILRDVNEDGARFAGCGNGPEKGRIH
jgi:hypothetical protein